MPSKREKADDWEVEAPLDLAATLEELIASPPFKEVSDEHGHSATAGTRIPFWLDRRVKLLKEMHGSPYELVSDVLRDAIFLGMRVLAMRHRMSPDWEVETKLAQIIDATGASRRIRNQVEELIKAIDEMLRDNDMDKAAEHLKKCSYSKIGVSDPLRFLDPLMAAVMALPIGVQHHKTAAVAAFKAGKIDVALKELREVVRANPDDPLARLNLGVVLAGSGDPDGAIEQYRQAIRLRPKFARAHCDLAAMLANKGAYDDALSHFIEAVTCDPQLFKAHWGLAKLAVVTGKHQLAVTHYALAVEIDPRHPEAREGHVVALTKAGRYADALDSLEKSRKVLPRSMTLAHAAARFWAACPEETLRDGPKALRLAKTVFRTLKCIEHAETLAMAFAETGNYERARKWQNDAIEAAKTEGRPDVIPRLKRNLALYNTGKPCRTPW